MARGGTAASNMWERRAAVGLNRSLAKQRSLTPCGLSQKME